MRFILNILAVMAAFWVTTKFVDGVTVQGDPSTAKYWGTLLVVALIFGVINAIV